MKKNVKDDSKIDLHKNPGNIFNADKDHNGKGIKVDDLIDLLKSE